MIALVLAPLIALAAPPPASACAPPQTALTSQGAPVHLRKLGDLPDAEMDLAVIRSVDGCWVKEVVRYNVSRRGPGGAPPAPATPTPGYTGQLVLQGPAARTTPTAR